MLHRGRIFEPILEWDGNNLIFDDSGVGFIKEVIPSNKYLPFVQKFSDIEIGFSRMIMTDLGELLAQSSFLSLPWYRLSLDESNNELHFVSIKQPLCVFSDF